MARALKRGLATSSEAPGPPEPRSTGRQQRVVVDFPGQRLGIPGARIEMDLVAVRDEAASQIGDVGAAAAAGGENLVVAECDIHVASMQPPMAACGLAISLLSRKRLA